MEWGLRKVLPETSEEKRGAFARHIIPVIVELCAPALSREEFDDLLARIDELFRSAGSGGGEGNRSDGEDGGG